MEPAFQYFFVITIFGLSLMYLLWPFFAPKVNTPKVKQSSKQDLLCKKQEVLENLRDYDLDHQMKKISDEDYRELYQETLASGVEILKKLEKDEKK